MYKRDIYVISSYSSKLTTLFNSEKKLEATKHANSENTPLHFNEQFLLRSNSAENPNSSHDESKTLTPQCLLFLSPSLSRVLFLVSSRSDSRFPLGFSSKCVAGGRRRGGTRCLHIRGDLTWLRKPLCRHDHGPLPLTFGSCSSHCFVLISVCLPRSCWFLICFVLSL